MDVAKNVIITVAPLAQHFYDEVNDFPTAIKLAEEIIECCKEGASVCHLHVIDEKGYPTFDTSFFRKVLQHVRSNCGVVMQSSTGGVSTLSRDEKSISVEVAGLEMASLNMASCNIGREAYINTPEDVIYWVEKMNRNDVKPEMVFFEPGMFTMLDNLRKLSLIEDSYVVNLALGFPSSLPATVENLAFMASKIPPHAEWSLTAHHERDFSLQSVAMALGGNVRIGFEDSMYLTPSLQARNNVELVKQAKKMIELFGRKVALPEEVRLRYGLKQNVLNNNLIKTL